MVQEQASDAIIQGGSRANPTRASARPACPRCKHRGLAHVKGRGKEQGYAAREARMRVRHAKWLDRTLDIAEGAVDTNSES